MCAAVRTTASAGCALSACGSRRAAARRLPPDGLRIEEQQGLFGFLYGPAQRSRADAKGGCMQFSVQYYRSGYREVPEFFALAARKT